MANIIYKYPLKLVNVQHVAMPKFANILCVQTQYNEVCLYENEPCLWVEIVPDGHPESRYIAIVGTGRPLYDYERYIGTFQLGSEGELVFHVFEISYMSIKPNGPYEWLGD